MTDWPVTGHPSIAAGGYLAPEGFFQVFDLWTTAKALLTLTRLSL
jgi:hypothetical protein